MASVVVNVVLLSGFLLFSRASSNYICEECKSKGGGFSCQMCKNSTETADFSLCPTMTSVYDCHSTSTEGVTSNPSSGSATSSRKYPIIDMDQGSVLEQSAKTPGCSSGSIIGALIGGTLFGSAVTAVVFLCIRRKLQTLHKKLSPSNAIQNPVYPLEDRSSQRIPDTAQLDGAHFVEVDDETRKSGNVSPLRQQDLEFETTPVTDDTYNLLNETDRIEVSDHYDHANPVPFPATLPDDGYGVVSFDSGDILAENKETSKNIPASNNNMSYEDVQNDDYFVLEKQTI